MQSEFEKTFKQHIDGLTAELSKLGKQRQVQLAEWDVEQNKADYEFYFNAGWQAAKAQAIPEGFVVVPVEPTERMLDSAYNSISDNLHYADLENIYKAMIWSAQEQAND